jgi:hypothetical protein
LASIASMATTPFTLRSFADIYGILASLTHFIVNIIALLIVL